MAKIQVLLRRMPVNEEQLPFDSRLVLTADKFEYISILDFQKCLRQDDFRIALRSHPAEDRPLCRLQIPDRRGNRDGSENSRDSRCRTHTGLPLDNTAQLVLDPVWPTLFRGSRSDMTSSGQGLGSKRRTSLPAKERGPFLHNLSTETRVRIRRYRDHRTSLAGIPRGIGDDSPTRFQSMGPAPTSAAAGLPDLNLDCRRIAPALVAADTDHGSSTPKRKFRWRALIAWLVVRFLRRARPKSEDDDDDRPSRAFQKAFEQLWTNSWFQVAIASACHSQCSFPTSLDYSPTSV